MRWLKLHKRLLGIIAALVLIVGVAGFSLTRGYLMHFVYDETTITRDEYFDNAYDTSENHLTMYCTSGAALGFIYLWEVRCYSMPEALEAYMGYSGSS